MVAKGAIEMKVSEDRTLAAKELAKYFDHTALKADVTHLDIHSLCAEAIELGTAAVCINPLWIPLAVKLLDGSDVMPITVVGFPLGATGTATKIYESREAIARGAREIDMVLSIGELRSDHQEAARRDIVEVKRACGDVPLKVIFETSLLSPAEIHKVALWCAKDGIDYVKTSTGFGARGASIEDIEIMREAINSVPQSQTKIKASGGIRNLADTMSMIEVGADRIGASATKAIVAELLGHAGKVTTIGY
jgi:deoxyribose-phosphate aldolase